MGTTIGILAGTLGFCGGSDWSYTKICHLVDVIAIHSFIHADINHYVSLQLSRSSLWSDALRKAARRESRPKRLGGTLRYRDFTHILYMHMFLLLKPWEPLFTSWNHFHLALTIKSIYDLKPKLHFDILVCSFWLLADRLIRRCSSLWKLVSSRSTSRSRHSRARFQNKN